jgi:TonB-linked SusC/RagA family outer membrane protein
MRRHVAGWLVLALLLGLPHFLSAQATRTVTGSVVGSETSEPIRAVRVAVKGTAISTITDAEGKFTLQVPSGATTLVFTYIGFRPVEFPIQDQMQVRMELQALVLQGVVVTALGIQRAQRSLATGTQAVSNSDLTDVPTTNVLSKLGGNVAGLQVTNTSNPFGSARIISRGASSITGENQPLIIVDGIPIDNSAASNTGYGGGSLGGYDVGNAAADIDPNNIQSLTVLKGPNAAALYGSRAANGAIVITTKKGEGAPSTGLGISATASTTIEQPLRLPDYQNRYGQGFYGEFDFVDGNFGGQNDGADESWGPMMDGRTSGCVMVPNTPFGTSNYDTSVPCHQFFGVGPWQAHPNNVRDFWETGISTSLNVAVARSSARNNVRLSFGRIGDNGMYPSNTNTRTNVALAGGAQISDRWSAEVSVNYINDAMQNQPAQAYEEMDPMQGFIWFGRQVDTRLLKNNLYRDPNDPLTQAILGAGTLRTDAPIPYSWNYSYHPNPYWMAQVKTTDFARDRGLGHVAATYKVNDWLSVSGRTGRDWYQNHFRANYPVNDISPYPLGGLLDVGETRSETNSDFLISAQRQLIEGLSVSANAGGNHRENNFNNNVGNVGQLVIPGVYTLANSAGQPATSLFQSTKKVNSLYGSANFDYHDWFYVELTGRNDWSSTLPKNRNSFFYPSVGGAFIFTDALGMNLSWLSYGKLRASWSRVGNDTDPYRLASVYGAGTPWGGQPSFTSPDQLPNSNLKPEQTTGVEVGADLGLLKDRVTLNATVYQKSTTDQILPVSISAATGFTSAIVNSGEVRNRGVELTATVKPIETPSFRWSMVANWSKNTNKVLSLYSGVSRIVVGNYWNVNVTADVGQPYGNLVGYRWARDAQGHILVDDGGLPIRDPKQVVLGNYNPDWIGGISNTFTYKSLSLSVALDGRWGGNVYSVTKWFGQYAGILSTTLQGRENDWNDPGYLVPNSVYASNGQPNTTRVLAQDYWHNTFYAQEDGIVDASFLKLRDVRLAYTLPSRVAGYLGFSGATVGLVGHNLLLWAKQKTIDPETAFDTGNRQGVENGQLPTTRSIGFTLSVQP